ncbi:hypothetical protein D3C72_1525680 [compost metagenome]
MILRAKAYLPVMARPLNSSNSMKLPRKSLSENGAEASLEVRPSPPAVCEAVMMSSLPAYFQMLNGVCIQPPTTTSHTRVTGMKIFQPRRMIWS